MTERALHGDHVTAGRDEPRRVEVAQVVQTDPGGAGVLLGEASRNYVLSSRLVFMGRVTRRPSIRLAGDSVCGLLATSTEP